jgi:tryptophan halogenase
MKKHPLNNIVIVGGGTAGWLSALYIRRMVPSASVTLIESSSIGILGAGEGSTPHLLDFLNLLEVDVVDLVKKTGSTFKNGIKFTNWNNGGEDDFYYHPFSLFPTFSYSSCNLPRYFTDTDNYIASALVSGNFTKNTFVAMLSEKRKAAFGEVRSTEEKEQYAHMGLHFDAVKLAAFLKEVAVDRGVQHIDGEVTRFTTDDEGNVTLLQLLSGIDVACDFVIDASGFARFFIKNLGATWHSYSKFLPADSAYPFFVEPNYDEDIPPYTESIAMKYGWIWKIPLQHRYGCGYVFDSSVVSEEEIKREIVSWLGYTPEFPRERSFKFSAGHYTTPWINNVLAVGLSSGFIEPLEATSIWVTIETLASLFTFPQQIVYRNQEVIKAYNETFSDQMTQVADFVHMHYLSTRSDTPFWNKFSKEKTSESLAFLLKTASNKMLGHNSLAGKLWNLESVYSIGIGVGLEEFVLPVKRYYESSYCKEEFDIYYSHIHSLHEYLVNNQAFGHRQFISYLTSQK